MKTIIPFHRLLAGLLPLIVATTAVGQDESADGEDTASGSIFELEPATVVGSKENIDFLPGSAAYIDTGDIRDQGYDDINRVVQRVPGVYFREEDGYGNFANLSLRGANSSRSSKVTMMEDGVLTSPAPYSAPAAYYTPTTGRMSGIEILKGSSQILYGPETTGGVINYLSTPIPQGRTGYIRSTYGTDNDVRIHAYYGDAVETPHGRVDYLFENYFRRTDGFKTIEERPGFNAGDDTGFTKNEPMFKVGWEPNTPNFQRLEFKIGYTDFDANETYLGVSNEDFNRRPYRRYAASRFDGIISNQTRTSLSHIIEPTPDLRLTTTAYYNKFNRNWSRLDGVSLDGISFGDPAVAIGEGTDLLDVLRGDREGFFKVGHNDRSYASYGIQNRLEYVFETGVLDHRIDAGIRLHEDYARRFHEGTIHTQDNNGAITDSQPVDPNVHTGNVSRRREEARAIAIFIQDRIGYEQWAFTPGIRYEHVRFKFRDGPNSGKDSLDTIAPGASLSYNHTENLTFFTGLHRGISMPGPRAHINNGIKEETTLSYELGTRYNNQRGFRTEVIFFYTDFDDLIVAESIGSGTVTGNAGKATSYGIEALAVYDPGIAHNWGFGNPNSLSITWTDATLDSDTTSADPGSIFSGGQKGDRLPYIPRYSISAGTGLEFSRISFYLDASYLPSMYATANNSRESVNPITGDPDARFGKIDDRLLLDISVHYKLTENAKAVAGIHNLLDEKYMVSRLPYGPRPGQPITAHIGLEVFF